MAQPFYNRKPLPNEGRLSEQELDYSKIIKIILSRWYWIAATLIIGLSISFLYLWYTPELYATSTNIKFDEKKSEFTDMVTIINSGDKGALRIQNESYVVRSREVILEALNSLDWQVSYFFKGKVRITETYPNKPFLVNIIKDAEFKPSFLFVFEYLGGNDFILSYLKGEKTIQKRYQYGKIITVDGFQFSLDRTSNPNEDSEYSFKFNTQEDLFQRIRNEVEFYETAKLSNIASLAMTDSNPYFARDAVNAIAKSYINYDVIQKAKSSDQIITFIDSQMALIGKEVNTSATHIETFKQNLKVSEIKDYSLNKQVAIDRLKDELFKLKLNVISLKQLNTQITNIDDKTSLSLNLFGSFEPILEGLITQYNQIIVKKIDARSIYNENSQPIREINSQLELLKNTIYKNINSQLVKASNEVKTNEERLSEFYNDLKTLPTAEKNMNILDRDFEVNQKIYSFLSEKRLEAQITKASILSSASLIEPAIAIIQPVSPDKSKIYRSTWILGILSGIGLIFLMRSINPYIYDKETVESITNVPIIGVIRKYAEKINKDDTEFLTLQKPKSIFAESVRSVRTNLSFLATEKGSKVVCITSEISGEGKSFVTLNLASTLAMIDKKVILLAGDLRRSKLYKTFKVPNTRGLSTYLSHQESDLKSLIQSSEQENLDFILSGPVPPNPSELLYSVRFTAMIEELKTLYDYILIDTAPIGLVSDAIPIIRQSDINLFIIRAGVSKFNSATIPQRIEQEYGLNNTVIVLNAFIEDALHSRYYSTKYTGHYNGYYYSDYSGYTGYGYYSDDDQKPWWKFWRKFKKEDQV